MAVEVVELLMERLMGERLISREIEVLAAVPNPINLKPNATSDVNQNAHASKQSCGSTCLEHQHERIHEKRRLREHVSIKIPVRNSREDGAASSLTNGIKLASPESAETDFLATSRFYIIGCSPETHFQCLLGSLEDAIVFSVELSRLIVIGVKVIRRLLRLDHVHDIHHAIVTRIARYRLLRGLGSHAVSFSHEVIRSDLSVRRAVRKETFWPRKPNRWVQRGQKLAWTAGKLNREQAL
jgi:hypothetical protein